MRDLDTEISSLKEDIEYLQEFKVKIETEYKEKFKKIEQDIKEEKNIQEKIEKGEDISEHLKKLQSKCNEWCVVYGYPVPTEMDVLI